MHRLIRGVGAILLFVVTGYLVVLGGLFLLQRSLLFPNVPAEPFLDLSGAERVQLVLPSWGTVPMDLSGPPAAPLVVFFHGNGEQIGQTRGDAAEAEAAGLRFAAVEYPGYGDAEGLPSEVSIFAAARAGLEHLARNGEGRPTCVGHSLGSGVAFAMSAEGRCARLVAISAYTSIVEMAARRFPWAPARWLVRDRFDSLSRAHTITVPTLLIHGRKDGLIPYEMSETLAAAIPNARLVERNRGHNDIRDQQTWAEVARFVGVGP
jgi:pimeloyl-ACP methyl ester carboxylesterase